MPWRAVTTFVPSALGRRHADLRSTPPADVEGAEVESPRAVVGVRGHNGIMTSATAAAA